MQHCRHVASPRSRAPYAEYRAASRTPFSTKDLREVSPRRIVGVEGAGEAMPLLPLAKDAGAQAIHMASCPLSSSTQQQRCVVSAWRSNGLIRRRANRRCVIDGYLSGATRGSQTARSNHPSNVGNPKLVLRVPLHPSPSKAAETGEAGETRADEVAARPSSDRWPTGADEAGK